MRPVVIAFLAAVAASSPCAATECDYSRANPTDCVAKGYPDAKIPPFDIWDKLKEHLRSTQDLANASDVAIRKAEDARAATEESCRFLYRYFPSCRKSQDIYSALSAAAHQSELRSYYALNKVIEETRAAYGLYPAAGPSGSSVLDS